MSFIDEALAAVPPETEAGLEVAYGGGPPTIPPEVAAGVETAYGGSLGNILADNPRAGLPAESPGIVSSVLRTITEVGTAAAGLLFRSSSGGQSTGYRPRPRQSIAERLAGTTQSTPITTKIPITAILLIVLGIVLIAMIGRGR